VLFLRFMEDITFVLMVQFEYNELSLSVVTYYFSIKKIILIKEHDGTVSALFESNDVLYWNFLFLYSRFTAMQKKQENWIYEHILFDLLTSFAFQIPLQTTHVARWPIVKQFFKAKKASQYAAYYHMTNSGQFITRSSLSLLIFGLWPILGICRMFCSYSDIMQV